MGEIIGTVLLTTSVVCGAVGVYLIGHAFGRLKVAADIAEHVDTDKLIMLRGGLVHVVSMERYRELRFRENHYFRYQRRYERQNEHLDD